ncbi:MAG: methyltransferase [Candidatus Pacearchaeota archaeon]|nr:methyltransferase [Candidatus Pacearchaeota archaeon]
MYQPREDSFLLASGVKKFLKKEKNKDIKILDMGTGSAIQALTAREQGFDNIVCADINQEAVNQARKLGFKSIKTNLFSRVKDKFDLIMFNPPYLPEDKYDKQKDTTGGKLGDETILAFFKQASSHLTKDGKILLLVSSLTPQTRILKLLEKSNLKKKLLARQKLFFEHLEIFQISIG